MSDDEEDQINPPQLEEQDKSNSNTSINEEDPTPEEYVNPIQLQLKKNQNLIRSFLLDVIPHLSIDEKLFVGYEPTEILTNLLKNKNIQNMFVFQADIVSATDSFIKVNSNKITQAFLDIKNSDFIGEYGIIRSKTDKLHLDYETFGISYIFNHIYITDSSNYIILLNCKHLSIKQHLGKHDFIFKACVGEQTINGNKEYSYIFNNKGSFYQVYNEEKYEIFDLDAFSSTYSISIIIYEKLFETSTSIIDYKKETTPNKQITPYYIFYSIVSKKFPEIVYKDRDQIEKIIRNDYNKNKIVSLITRHKNCMPLKNQYELSLGQFNEDHFQSYSLKDRKAFRELAEYRIFMKDFDVTKINLLLPDFISQVNTFFSKIDSPESSYLSLQERLRNEITSTKIPVKAYLEKVYHSFSANNAAEWLCSNVKLPEATKKELIAISKSEGLNDMQTLCLATYINSSIAVTRNGTRYILILKEQWIELFIVDEDTAICLARIWKGPSSGTLYRWYREFKEMNGSPHMYMQGNSIKNQLEFWGKKFNYTNEPAILAIDAMSLQKHVRIDDNGNVYGVIEPMQIPQMMVNTFKRDTYAFNNFLKKLDKEHKLIKAVFVIMLVTLNDKKSVPIYIKFSNSGSADEDIENLLKTFAEEVENSRYFKSYGLAFDGDRRYIGFHIKFLNYWFSIFIKIPYELTQCINQIERTKLIFGDAPHLLKRCRYYIVNHDNFIIGQYTTKTITSISIQQILSKEIIPSYVWNKSPNTKMDDNFPRLLFTPQALITLMLNQNWVALGMFLPPVLLSCYYYINMSRNEILEILSIGFYFTYLLLIEETGKPLDSIYKKSKNTKNSSKAKATAVRKIVSLENEDLENDEEEALVINKTKYFQIIDIQWGIEYLNTIISILFVLNNSQKSFSTERLGTMLDEHFFSRMRKNSGTVKTYERFLDVFDRIIYANQMNKELVGSRSHARFPPAIIPPNTERHKLSLKTSKSSKKIAEYFYCLVTGKHNIKHPGFSDINSENPSYSPINEYFVYFKNLMKTLQNRLDNQDQNHELSSSESVIRPNRTATIYSTLYQ